MIKYILMQKAVSAAYLMSVEIGQAGRNRFDPELHISEELVMAALHMVRHCRAEYCIAPVPLLLLLSSLARRSCAIASTAVSLVSSAHCSSWSIGHFK